jgi:hypothetical protein
VTHSSRWRAVGSDMRNRNMNPTGVRVLLANFDKDFNYDTDSINYIYSDGIMRDIIFVPLPTEKPGKNILRYILEEYKIIEDSNTMTRPMFINYEYVVE